jgi:hypothetical protein
MRRAKKSEKSSRSHNCARPSHAAVAKDVEEDDSEKHQEDLDDGGDTACWANDNNFGTVGRGTGTAQSFLTKTPIGQRLESFVRYPNKLLTIGCMATGLIT